MKQLLSIMLKIKIEIEIEKVKIHIHIVICVRTNDYNNDIMVINEKISIYSDLTPFVSYSCLCLLYEEFLQFVMIYLTL